MLFLGLWVAGASSRLGAQALQLAAPLLSLQPTTQGAFLRGSGLSLASGRFTAPVTAIFQFSASLHMGERADQRGVGGAGSPRWDLASQSCLLLQAQLPLGAGTGLHAQPLLAVCPEAPFFPLVPPPVPA